MSPTPPTQGASCVKCQFVQKNQVWCTQVYSSPAVSQALLSHMPFMPQFFLNTSDDESPCPALIRGTCLRSYPKSVWQYPDSSCICFSTALQLLLRNISPEDFTEEIHWMVSHGTVVPSISSVWGWLSAHPVM